MNKKTEPKWDSAKSANIRRTEMPAGKERDNEAEAVFDYINGPEFSITDEQLSIC